MPVSSTPTRAQPTQRRCAAWATPWRIAVLTAAASGPLARPAWEARRAEQKAALEAASPNLDKGPPRYAVALFEDKAATVAPSPSGKTDDRLSKWGENLGHDPWIEECLFILEDMAGSPASK